MKASDCMLADLLGHPCQYIVPSFQRAYRWDEERRTTFVDGVLDAFRRDPEHEIFLGAIAIMPIAATRTGLRKYLLVDGQQRLMLALFAALRDVGRERGNKDSKIIEDTLLLNPGAEGNYRFKLLPHPRNRAGFFQALGEGVRSGPDEFAAAASFLKRLHREPRLDYGQFCSFLLRNFMVVLIELERDENPYPIYRSLNMWDAPPPAEQMHAYQRFGDDPALMALIAGGESEVLEFKEGLSSPQSAEKGMENHAKNLVRSVSGFMNSINGGMLLLGVTDDGAVRGVNREYVAIDRGKGNWDGYVLHLRNVLRSRLDVEAPFRFYQIQRHVVRKRDVCAISVDPANAPVYVDKRLYVRAGNQTIEMLGPDLVAYVHERWPEFGEVTA